jgi:vitamin B12 transporter
MRYASLFLGAALAVPGLAFAGPVSPTPVSDLVVEATRLPTMLVDAPDVRVIDRAQIDARQAVWAADILTTVPGLALTRNGAFGGVTSVRIRGASSDKTLVLIDGVPQNDVSNPNGVYDFANLDLSDIERIEILSGPQSSLWGSDAIGGVISLTTRETDGWRASAEGGTLATFDGSAAIGRRTDAWAVGASIFGDRSDGVAKADGIGPANPYWSWSAGAYGRLTPSNAISLDARARYVQSYASVDGYDANTFAFGYTPQYATSRGWSGQARAIAQAPLGFTDTVSVGLYSLDRSDTYIGQPASSSRFTAQSQDYRFTTERGGPTDAFGVVFGAERQNTEASLSTGARQGLGTTSGFAVVRLRPVGPLTVTASERYDAPDSYAASATGHLAAVLKLGGGFSLEGAWGQGFKTPTISEIACDFCFPAGPSKGLKPEHAQGWDAGIAWASADGAYSARLTGYELAVKDQIAFSPSFPFVYVNLERTRTTGLEAEADARLTRELSLSAEYAYTDARDLGAGTQMLRVPANTGSVSLNWTRGRWRGEVTVRAEGPDADINPSTFTPQRRPGFVLANVSGAYELSPRLELTARVEDLANTHYQEALGYGEPRRMIFFGLRAKG